MPGETHFAQAELQSAQTVKINTKDLIKWRDPYNGQMIFAEVQSFVVDLSLPDHEVRMLSCFGHNNTFSSFELCNSDVLRRVIWEIDIPKASICNLWYAT